MSPTIVHRYAWPIREAIEHLLGDAAGDCEGWRIRVEGDELVIDVVAPTYAGRTVEVPDNFDIDKLCDMIEAGEFKPPAPAARVTVEEAPSVEMPVPDEPAAPEKLKGGALAQRAGIMCGEKGFWRFVGEKHNVQISSADAAATWLRNDCGVDSRADLDHIPDAAEVFRGIEKAYRFWLEGYD